jgi:hypothetical protein
VNRRRHITRVVRIWIERLVRNRKRLVVNRVHPASLNILGLHPVLERAICNHAIELSVPIFRIQQIAIVAAKHLYAAVIAVFHLLGRKIDANRVCSTSLCQSQQVTIAAADFKQAETRTIAADLVKKIIQLPFDALFKRLVFWQVFAIGKISDSDRFGSVHERVTKLHELCRRDPRLWLGQPESFGNFNGRAFRRDTRLAFDNRHEISPVGRSFKMVSCHHIVARSANNFHRLVGQNGGANFSQPLRGELPDGLR